MYKIIDKNKIEINGKEITLPYSIHLSLEEKLPFILEFNSLIIVNFMATGEDTTLEELKKDKENYESNVWAFDQEGNLVWRIEKIKWYPGERGTYTAIEVKNGRLQAYNAVGVDMLVDPTSGKVTNADDKRPW